jgi:hypothetical protein
VSDTLFQFTIPGQPPSWNQSYRHRTITLKDAHGQPVLGNDLQPKKVSRLYKEADVKTWQAQVAMIAELPSPLRLRRRTRSSWGTRCTLNGAWMLIT